MVSDDLAGSEVVATADAGSGGAVPEGQNANLTSHGKAVIEYGETMKGNAARLR